MPVSTWSSLWSRPRWPLLGTAALLCGMVLSCLITAFAHRREDDVERAWSRPQSPGGPPWGQLSKADIQLHPPEELVESMKCDGTFRPWRFVGYTARQLEQLFDTAGLDAVQRARLRGAATCEDRPDRQCTIQPDLDLVASLSTAARGVIYEALASDQFNADQASGFHIRAAKLDGWLAGSRLRSEVVTRFRSMLYRSGDFVHFADFQLLCRSLSPADQHDLLLALSHVPSLRVSLHVPQGAPVDGLVRYWGIGGREETLRYLLESLARRPGGGSIDLADVLPYFARAHLYTYSSQGTRARDCKWTALNFFNHGLDTVEVNDAHLEAALKNRYHPIDPSQARLGDLVVYQDEHYGFIHVATYIADDIVFVKNGIYLMWPWTLATLAFERDLYQYRAGVREIYYHADGLK